MQRSAWELLRSEARLHPTIAEALSESLAEWLREELDFESVYAATHDWDSASAQEGFKDAVKRLMEFGERAEAVLEDVRDNHWPAPLQAMLHEATSLDEISELLAELDYSHGSIRSCIDFSFQAAVERHIVDNCSDEDTMELWQESGQRVAEEQWEELRTHALKDLRAVVDALEGIKNRLIAKLQAPVDNT